MPRKPSNHIDDPVALGQRLRQARKSAGLTQRELSFPGCTSAYVARIESGERRPSLQILHEFARRLHVTPEFLATGQKVDTALRVTSLLQELDEPHPKEVLDEALQKQEIALLEHISQHEEDLELIRSMRQALRDSHVSDG